MLRLDSITCLVDAEGIFADPVVLNKTDLVGPEHLEVVKEWINHHLHRIRIIDATRCDVPLEVLLAVGRFDPAHVVAQYQIESENHEHLHGHGAVGNLFDTWSYESDQPFSLATLREMVRKELPASIYRCKGILFAVDSPNSRIALQIVGRRTEISSLDEWGDRTPLTQIVAIGSRIDAGELTSKFDACVRPD